MSANLQKIIEEYRGIASDHGKATACGDYESANRNHDKLLELLPKIRDLGREGEIALLLLTEDGDDAVACWAATHSLKSDVN